MELKTERELKKMNELELLGYSCCIAEYIQKLKEHTDLISKINNKENKDD